MIMTPVVPVMLFVLVMVVAAFLFAGWVVVSIIRLLWRAVTSSPSASSAAAPRAMDSRMCVRDHCRAINPSQAKFCRRCGSAMNGVATAQRGLAG
jgi:ribosomal protein L40E